MGIVNVTEDRHKTLKMSSNAALQSCPDAGASTEPHEAGCYDGFLPCHGHGQCASGDGGCIYAHQSFLDAKPAGACQCWGSGITMEKANPSALLPNTVAMYGGNDCGLECPGADKLADFYNTNYAVLLSSNYLISPQHKAKKFSFFSKYEHNMCSGHGYCTPDSEQSTTNTSQLRCTCVGNFGGDMCDKQCTLDKRSWAERRPMQSRVIFTADEVDELAAKLSSYYGLSKCGTNARCRDDNVCVPVDEGNYGRQPYLSGLDSVARMSRGATNSTRVMDFFEQWSMTFVGEFATCAGGYYSSVLKDLGGQDTTYAFDLPTLVRWQLVRTCDALYEPKMWSDSGNAWCCTYPREEYEWHDDTAANFNGFTHGGCPDGYCTNFGVDRSCRTCVSNAFDTYTSSTAKTCPTSDSGEGYCAKCAGGLEEHLVSPVKSLIDANTKKMTYKVRGEWACEKCISQGRELSGEQKYAIAAADFRVCNNDLFVARGKCLGMPNTYSGIGKYDDVADVTTGSLLCEAEAPNFQLGLCECAEGWEGPTCAMPALKSSCRNGGVLTGVGVISKYKLNQTRGYYKCVCEPGADGGMARTGHYCGGNAVENIWGFASAELLPCQSVQMIPSKGPALVECNDASGANPCNIAGRCDTCTDPSLDPDAMCMEYKATGPDGIVTQHLSRVEARSNC
jgi:hypothetical protein